MNTRTRTLSPAGLYAALLGATLAAWAVLLVRMRGMDAGPGTDLGTLGWYVGVWVTMTAAMMLPSTSPMLLVYAKVASGSSRRPAVSTAVFLAGYVVVVDRLRSRRLRPVPARPRARSVLRRLEPRRADRRRSGDRARRACTS